MVEQVTFQIIFQFLQTVGILVGVFYYIMTIRTNQKNQEIAQKNQELTLRAQQQSEETRKIQLLLEHNRYIMSGNNWNAVMSMEWNDYDDFISKYGWESNPDLYDKRYGIWRRTHVSGLLVRDGLIDISTYIDYISDNAPIMWNKFKDLIEEMRILYDSPELFIGIECLANEVEKYRLSRGIKAKVVLDDQ